MNCLLSDSVFDVRLPGGELRTLTLPGVLATLSSAEIESFSQLQYHQRHAWFAFLVQLAAQGLAASNRERPPREEKEWTRILRGLTKGFAADEPWSLVVDDLKLPALLQPPVPGGTLKGFSGPYTRPGKLEILVLAKNHDVKKDRIGVPSPAHWVYHLVALQTMQGFSGLFNYGIARMNSGFGSRPRVGLERADCWSSRFQRDLQVLLDARSGLLDRSPHYARRGGLGLLWLEAWDGRSSRSLEKLDPYFIEVCRRIRLTRDGGRISAYRAPSKAPRLAAKDLNGNTGDAWTPVERGETPAALTLGAAGWTYRKLASVLFSSEFQPAPAQEIRADDPRGGLSIRCETLVRGKGKTEGFHTRCLPIPASAHDLLADPQERDRLGELARARIEDVSTFSRKVLRTALLALVQGGAPDLKMSDESAAPALASFDADVDDVFFTDLWDWIGLDEAAARLHWRTRLLELGRRCLAAAEAELPVAVARRHRAIAAAWSRLEGGARKIFPELKRREEDADEHE